MKRRHPHKLEWARTRRPDQLAFRCRCQAWPDRPMRAATEPEVRTAYREHLVAVGVIA